MEDQIEYLTDDLADAIEGAQLGTAWDAAQRLKHATLATPVSPSPETFRALVESIEKLLGRVTLPRSQKVVTRRDVISTKGGFYGAENEPRNA